MPSSSTAVLYDQHLRLLAAHYDNMGAGRQASATYVVNFFHELVGIATPELFVEVGAYRAEASRRVKADQPSCRVVAYEANPYNHAHYVDSLGFAANGIEYINAAVSDAEGRATFHLRRRQGGEDLRPVTGNSSLLRLEATDVDYEDIDVAAVTLDAQFPALDSSAALWVDAEGASREVLSGAVRMLKSVDLIMIEVEEKPSWQHQWTALDVTTFLVGAGFVPITRDIEYEQQHNVVFVSNRLYANPAVLMSLELHLNYLRHHMGSR